MKMLRSSLFAAAAASVAHAIVGPSPGPFAGYLCKPQLVDAAGVAWQFDLTSVAGVEGNTSSNGYGFTFATCGVSSYQCTNTGEAWTYAAGVQIEGGGTCEVLSAPQSVPQWSLLNTANASAGAQFTLTAARTGTTDWGKCNVDPRTGTETGRTMVLQLSCDDTLPAGTIKVTGQYEQPECNYVIQVSTAAACPTKITNPPPLPPASAPAVPVPPGYNAYGAAGPFAPYLCQPTLTDSTGASYSYDLTSTYTAAQAQGWDFNVTAGGQVYSLALCGFANTVCVPQGYTVLANYGTAVQSATGGAPAGACYATNSSTVPCTPMCHVLADEPVAWTLLKGTNGAAGITATYPPVYTTADDPFQCPYDPVTMMPAPRQLTVNLACDATVAPGQVVIDSVNEPAACSFVAAGRSAVACGTKQ